MKKIFYILIFVILLPFIFGGSCKEKTTYEGDAIAPDKVNLLPHSWQDNSYDPVYLLNDRECGIHSEANLEAITIVWEIPTTNADASPLEDLAGFRLYRSQLNDSLNAPYFDKEDSLLAVLFPTDNRYIDFNLKIGVRYYYNIVAFDYSQSQNTSVPSDTVDYKIIEKPLLTIPLNNATFDTIPNFAWYEVPDGQGAFYYYFVKVFDDDKSIIWKSRAFFSQDSLKVAYGDSGGIAKEGYENSLPNGKYFWRVDAVKAGENNTGSASEMRAFFVTSTKR